MNFGVASDHPVLTPGPEILENDPFDTALPKSSGPGIGSKVRSISTRRGSSAFEEVDVEEEVGH